MQLTSDDKSAEILCSLLLEVAGRDATRLISVRRHAAVLARAIPFMTKEQASVARSRIASLETKWGSLLSRHPEAPENGGIPPETIVARWLSKRRHRDRLLEVVYRAAVCISEGEDRLLNVMDHAYQLQLDRILPTVGYDSFKEWMVQLRIGHFEPGGQVRPGPLCKWWIDNMAPDARSEGAYAACLAETARNPLTASA